MDEFTLGESLEKDTGKGGKDKGREKRKKGKEKKTK